MLRLAERVRTTGSALGIAAALAAQDIRDNYARSKLGPIWITTFVSVQIAALGLVLSQVLRTGLRDYLPSLAVGLVIWTFVSQSMIEAGGAFTLSRAITHQVRISVVMPVFRVLIKNLMIFAHTLPVALVVTGLFSGLGSMSGIAVIGFALLTVNLFWVSTILAIVAVKFRDVPPLVSSAMMTLFYVTPVVWLPSQLPEEVKVWVLTPNPFYHALESIRSPLVNNVAPWESLSFLLLLGIAGLVVARSVLVKYSWRVAYWI